MTSSAGRFTTLRLGDGSPSSQGIPDCYKGKRGQQLWIPGYRTQKTQKGVNIDHSYSGNNICRSSFLPDNPFSHLSWFPSHLPVAHQEQSAPSCKSWIPCYHRWSRRLTVAFPWKGWMQSFIQKPMCWNKF